jgi:hypothetical protein
LSLASTHRWKQILEQPKYTFREDGEMHREYIRYCRYSYGSEDFGTLCVCDYECERVYVFVCVIVTVWMCYCVCVYVNVCVCV